MDIGEVMANIANMLFHSTDITLLLRVYSSLYAKCEYPFIELRASCYDNNGRWIVSQKKTTININFAACVHISRNNSDPDHPNPNRIGCG